MGQIPATIAAIVILPVSMARSMHIRPRLVDFRVNGESGCVNGLFAYDDLAIFVDQDEVADADLWEVSRKRVEPYNDM
jgi:hypothetical protein